MHWAINGGAPADNSTWNNLCTVATYMGANWKNANTNWEYAYCDPALSNKLISNSWNIKNKCTDSCSEELATDISSSYLDTML